jgi:superfamily II DNA helicase RecQ
MAGQADDVSMTPPVVSLPKAGRRAPRDRTPVGARAGGPALRARASRLPIEPDHDRSVHSAVSAAGVSDALRAWRIEQARRRGVAPFVILHDRTLDAIASSLPRSLEELHRLPGIGPAKLDAYGDTILSVVASVVARTER